MDDIYSIFYNLSKLIEKDGVSVSSHNDTLENILLKENTELKVICTEAVQIITELSQVTNDINAFNSYIQGKFNHLNRKIIYLNSKIKCFEGKYE